MCVTLDFRRDVDDPRGVEQAESRRMFGHRQAVAGAQHGHRCTGDALDVRVDRLVQRRVEQRVDVADVDGGNPVAEGPCGLGVELGVRLPGIAEQHPAQVRVALDQACRALQLVPVPGALDEFGLVQPQVAQEDWTAGDGVEVHEELET